jgi:site-specific DNA-methyltransferase (adenine-specific)
LFDLLRPLLPPVPEGIEELVRSRTVESENMKRRKVIGEHTGTSPGCSMRTGILGGKKDAVGVVTAPATDAARQWQGWGTALKPAHEPICMARKPLVGTVAANVLRYGTGAINVDGCRVGDEKPAMERYKHPHNYSQGVTWVSRERVVPDSMPEGRWPANVLHDGSDEATEGLRDAARYFYTAKASGEDRDEMLGDVPKNVHPTVKPTDLMRYLVRMVTPPGGIVLDPFTGSGSTGRAAMLEGMRFVGCELWPEYAEIARARIRFTLGPLFAHEVI